VTRDGVRVVSAQQLGSLARLEPLARRVFGDGRRVSGWFDRKLRRESVDAALSRVAIAGPKTDDPGAWIGYVLVGTPSSLRPAARTAGTGVVERWRGRGVGTRLLQDVARACAAAGHPSLELLAEEDRIPFYQRAGFELRRRCVTVEGRGRGASTALAPPGAWDRPGLVELAAWLPETWAGTPEHERASVTVEHQGVSACAHVTREGHAWVAHRVLASTATPSRAAAAVSGLLSCFGNDTPVMLFGLDPVSSITDELWLRGWRAAQRCALLERSLREGAIDPVV
jgi:GNAT superfamily N-acetyltransferase